MELLVFYCLFIQQKSSTELYSGKDFSHLFTLFLKKALFQVNKFE